MYSTGPTLRTSGTGDYHLYVTNVPPEKLAAEDIGAVYSLRWQIELLFRELKTHYRIEDMPSSKRVLVEVLLFAAFLTMVVSRRLLALVRRRLAAMAGRIRSRGGRRSSSPSRTNS